LSIALMLLAPAAARANCNIFHTNVAFGVYNPTSDSPADFSGTLTLTCNAGSGSGSYTIVLSTGADSGTYAGRNMLGGGTDLPYQLFRDAAHTQIWGNGTGGSVIFTGSDGLPKTGGTAEITVYGQIAAHRTVPLGSYVDGGQIRS
jgi:spore coat protein U-like protein